jgi:hypothetical protein
MMNKPNFSLLVTLVSLILSINIVVFGQGTTSRLTGAVTDNAGAAVAGANVTLTNEGTKVS